MNDKTLNEATPSQEERDFVSALRADLNAPLTSIRGYAELLLAGALGPLTDEQRKFIEIIHQNDEKALKTLSGYVSLARARSETLHRATEVLDIVAHIKSVVKGARARIEAKGQTLVMQLPKSLHVRSSRWELEEVLSTIIENANRYTPSGGEIVLRVEREDEFARVSICDTGIGMKPEDQEYIFKRCHRGNAPIVQEQVGIGFSLYLAKLHMDKLGGEIGFESMRGKGSTFWFTLPVAEPLGG